MTLEVDEIIRIHRSIGVHSERGPLPGDVDIYPHGRDQAPLCGAVAGTDAANLATIAEQLGDNDFLVLHQIEPLVILPWGTWASLISKARP